PLNSYLRTIVDKRPELKMKSKQFRARVAELAAQLDMDPANLDRELNVGFSGGEKKKVEMLQLLLLQPKLAILDETDSGLDVDALGVVSRGIEAYRESCNGALIVITHNTRILERLDVDRTHVMMRGHMVAEGGADLINEIDREGFEQFESYFTQKDGK
ncbi:MAG: Fe-S cluster assembly ATPase SufC, partial [Atopobium minutum]|nr:Fe-S cluster assembly ATPase SufC [Atopobium minutum]